MSKRVQTPKEETANALTHGIGILFCLIGMPFLLNQAYTQESHIFWAAFVFGIGMLMVYTSSTLYHLAKNPATKAKLRVADHVSIYFLIAGTYSPLIANYLPKEKAIFFLIIMWGLVAIGTLFKLFFTHRFKIVSVIVYLSMGWMIVFMIIPLRENMPASLLPWMVAGGLSYTLGVYFYIKSNKPYYHAIWHACVLGGTVAHYIFVYKSSLG